MGYDCKIIEKDVKHKIHSNFVMWKRALSRVPFHFVHLKPHITTFTVVKKQIIRPFQYVCQY